MHRLVLNDDKELQTLQGLLVDPSEGQHLSYLASRVPDDTFIVEIGSYKGKSACFMASGAKTYGVKTKIYCIDMWELGRGNTNPIYQTKHGAEEGVYRDFMKQTAQHSDMIVAMKMSSEEAIKEWNYPIGLLHIDGSHTFEACKMDYEMWSKFVVKGGYIAFHDYSNPGPAGKLGVDPVVETIVKPSGLWTDYAHYGWLWSARRK